MIVFIPEKLSESTLYTITIKKGLKIIDSDSSLKDYVFKFETASSSSDDDRFNELFFNNFMNEFSPSEKPALPINYYSNYGSYKTADINTVIYSYKNVDSFIEALKKKNSVPSWANINYNKNHIDVSNLSRVLEFKSKVQFFEEKEDYLQIPKELPQGCILLIVNGII